MDPEKEVLRQLGELDVDKLKLVHAELSLAEITDETKKDSESYIRKMIMRHLSSADVIDSEDEGVSTYLHLNTFIETLTKMEDPKETDEKPANGDETATKTDVTLTDDTDTAKVSKTNERSAQNDSDRHSDRKFNRQQKDLLRSSF